jgi:hypothetical protein
MAGAVHPSGTRCPYGIIAALCLVPWGGSTATAQPISQQMEQQRRAQAELREALEQSERRIAAAQAEQIRNAQERAEQQRRAQAEADRRQEAEQRREERLAQARAQAQQSSPPQPRDAMEAQQSGLEEAAAPLPTSALEPLPRRYSLMRQIGLVLMIGSSIAALFVLGRIVQEYLARQAE